MDYMFYGSNSLISLNLSNFKTLSLESMKYMFYNCYSLINIDLSNFDTFQVKEMISLFQNCRSLISVDLSKFFFVYTNMNKNRITKILFTTQIS